MPDLNLGNVYYVIGIFYFIVALISNILIAKRTKRELKLKPGTKSIKTKLILWNILIIVVFVLAFFGYRKILDILSIQAPQKIVLIIPHDHEKDSPPFNDGERQFNGYMRLIKKHPEISSDFQFIIKNHNMERDTAEKIIKEELEKGTEYFVCTMSEVTQYISNKFEDLVRSYAPTKKNPKLIITVSSSMEVKTKKNHIYRFYIRSLEEADKLAEAAHEDLESRTATFIIVNDAYGKGALAEFKKRWEDIYLYNLVTGVELDKSWSEEKIEAEIRTKLLNKYQDIDSLIIFIVHYGNGVTSIFKTLEKHNVRSSILATSTASDCEIVEKFEGYLSNINWIICVPERTDGKVICSDVIEDFFYYALHRLVRTIDNVKISKISFDEGWYNCIEPKGVLDNPDGKERDGDTIIEVVTMQNIK
ncbi:hypothetical protein ACFLRM_06005 [Acidobacteriota bacterium]